MGMKILLSSAKTMGPYPISGTQNPHFLEDAIKLHAKMAKWSLKKIADYHGTSPALSAKVAAGIATNLTHTTTHIGQENTDIGLLP